ncbi:MAG: hypothetical protein IIC46_11925 [Planctomycetes bacterium]|nr:hypothetical protein [Planctomycetota bacterium]
MKSRPISDYIRFGTGLRYLQDAEPNWSIHKKGTILTNIDDFLTLIKEYDLIVTERAAFRLQELRDELAETASGASLTVIQAKALGSVIRNLRRTLFAEAKGRVAFIVTDKRIDVHKLLSNVGVLFAPGVFEKLPEISRYDFAEAGKCVAFERPTSGAFHLLRGTEDVLRRTYCEIVKRNRAKLMWGPMVESLRKRRSAPPKPLLDNLDNIRMSFRNPTQHPDKIYDIQEVQDLFALCVDVVNRMAALLPRKS